MLQFDILGLIPQSLKRQALDTLVDFVSEQARKYASEEIAARIKKLRSDAAFNQAFEEGLKRAIQRFVQEYEIQDEDLVAAIAADADLFKNEEVRAALLTILKKPGVYLAGERERLAESFDNVLPGRKNRERVDRAVIYLLKCLAEEVWHLPELQPIYSLQFQRMTAEATRQQVELQKAQLQALTNLNAGVREALLQLTDAIAERKLLPAGEAPTLPAPPSKPQVYHNLPQPDYGRFVGREQELAQVARILRPYPHSQHALVTIDGIGGIGKSALALEVAHRYLRNYERIPPEERFEAIIWISAKQSVLTAEGIQLRGQALRTLDDIYTAIAIALEREDITRARPEEQAEVVRNALARQRSLLIVDNLETVDDEAVLTFLRELPAPTKAIVTTRHRVDVAYPVRLVGMPWEDAQALIAQECDKKVVSLNSDEARRLYDRTGGVPLAIVWSIAQMGFGYSVEAVLIRLGQPIGDIARFCFEGAVERIRGKPAYKLLTALSLFATDASRKALGYVADLPELDRDEGLVMLEKLSLVNKSGRRFKLLPLTENFAVAQLKRNPALEERQQLAFIQFFLDICRKFGGEQWRLYGYLDEDQKNIQLALEWAYHLRMWQEVGDFIDNLVEFLEKRSLWNDLVDYSDMAVEAGIEMDDKGLTMRHKVFGLGWVKAVRFREYEEALVSIEEGKKLALELGDQREYAIALFDEHVVYRGLGQQDRAKDLLEKSLNIWRAIGDNRWEVRTLGAIGTLERIGGKLEKALDNYTGALKKAKETGETVEIALCLQRLGNVLRRMGRFEEARVHLMESLRMNEQLNIPYQIAYCNLSLARSENSLGMVREARKHAERAREMLSKLGQKHLLEETEELLDTLN